MPPYREERRGREAEIRDIVALKLDASGEKDRYGGSAITVVVCKCHALWRRLTFPCPCCERCCRLKMVLRDRLLECGWFDALRHHCRGITAAAPFVHLVISPPPPPPPRSPSACSLPSLSGPGAEGWCGHLTVVDPMQLPPCVDLSGAQR